MSNRELEHRRSRPCLACAFRSQPRRLAEDFFWMGVSFAVWTGVAALATVWTIFLLALVRRTWEGLL